MITDLTELVPIAQSTLWSGLVVFLRVGAMLSLMPAFGEQSVPARVRLGLAIAFTLLVAPALPNPLALPSTFQSGLAIGGAEILSGLFLGILLRLFVFVLQIAGTIAAQATSLSQIFGGSPGIDPQPAIGNLLVIAGLALATLMGLHIRVAAFMIESYQLFPAGQIPHPSTIAAVGVKELSRTFAFAFALAIPFVIASLIYNVTLGIINRAMPQLMVAFVGAPAITAGGLFLLLIASPVMLAVWLEAFHSFLDAPFRATP